MIKETFNLNKNGWYVRLMKFTWQYDYSDFSHICPFFWLTVFNVLIFPITCLLKLLKVLILAPIGALAGWFEEMADQRELKEYKWRESTLKEINKGNLPPEKFCELYFQHGCTKRYNNFLNWWSYESDEASFQNWQFYKEELRKKMEINKEAALKYEEIKQKAAIERKKKISKMLNWIKPIASVFMWFVLGSVLGFAVWGLIWAIPQIIAWYNTLPDVDWIKARNAFGIALALLFILVGFVWGLKAIVTKSAHCERCCIFWNNVGKAFYYIGLGAWQVPLNIYRFFVLLLNILKNNCPSIDWK